VSAHAPDVAAGVESTSIRRQGTRDDARRRDLARLRLRLCVLYGISSCIGLIVLATLVTVVDGRSRAESVRSELHRRASLASALVFPDQNGEPQTSAIEDDGIVSDGRVDLVLFSGAGSGPFDLVCVVDDGGRLCDEPGDVERWRRFERLADASFVVEAVQDEVDAGTAGRASGAGGRSRSAVAVPLYDGRRASGAVVAVDRGSLAGADRQHERLVMMTWLGCGLLAIASTVAGWLVAGRSMRPVVDALDQQERFLADAAHELRTPVSRVRAVAESALLSLDGLIRTLPHPKERGDELQGRLDEVQADLRRTVELAEGNGRVVDDLLFMSRVDADAVDLRRGPVRLDQLVSRLEDDHPDVVAEVDEPLVVHGDEVLLRRVLENLIDNARAHGRPPDGAPTPPIELTVWRSSPGDRQQGESSPMAVVTVADHGPGIAPEVLARAFERYGARSGSPGTGLGLAIVAWVVERHGGSVVAVNRAAPETGAIVGIRLPLVRSVG
jgi:two-component system OmpR family sensor kinase